MQSAKPLIIDSMKKLKPSSVLDLGCGKGKFSKIFIDRKIDTVGVDKEATAKSYNSFKFVQQNILEFKFEPKYDLIMGSGILHFLEKENACQIIKNMKKNTLLGGHHFLICMSNEEKSNDKIHFYPDKEELSKLYSDWEIIHNVPCLSKKHGKLKHQHKLIVFLAKK